MERLDKLADRYAPVVPEVGGTLAEGYWTGAAEGELRLPRCERCGHVHWYPLQRCPECGGAWHWEAVRPTATLFTWTVIRWPLAPAFEQRLGEIVALVVPDDASHIRLVTNLVDVAEPEIGMPLTAHFVPVEGGLAVPIFSSSQQI